MTANYCDYCHKPLPPSPADAPDVPCICAECYNRGNGFHEEPILHIAFVDDLFFVDGEPEQEEGDGESSSKRLPTTASKLPG